MQNAITPYNFNGASVRVVDRNGEPWFVAADVCRVLEIADHAQSTRYLDDDEKGLFSIQTPGGSQQVQVVSESGLYSLILRSRKPEAKAFKRWITHEVIPSIRKTGSYSVGKAVPTTFADALRAYAAEVEAREQLALKAAEDAPKVEFYNQVAESPDTLSFNDAAKLLGIGRNNLMRMCREEGILDANNVPYQRYIDAGYFRVIEGFYNDSKDVPHITRTPKVYQLGLDFLRRRFFEA